MTTDARKEYLREWRKNNRDKVNAAKKRYLEAHPDQKQKQAKYYKGWAESNREHLNEYHRNYYRRKVVAVMNKGGKTKHE